MKKKVTVQQIADAVNMSKYAVSRALSGKSGVSEETRALIVNTAMKMGYQTKSLPSITNNRENLIINETIQTILVLFPNVKYQDKDSIYWGPIFNGVSHRLNELKINILTLTEPAHDSIFTLLNPDAIQGAIVIGNVSNQTLLDLKQINIPMIMVDHLDSSILCDTIFIDNYTAISTLMKDLIEKGYNHYQFIGQIKEAHSFYERWLTFKNALDEAQIEHNQIDELIYFDNHLKAVVKELFSYKQLPQVFVCANDLYAYYTREALDELGYVINKDYLLTGFDFTEPDLPLYATVHVLKEELGKRAVDQMIWRIHNLHSPFERKLMHAEVIYNKNN